MVRLSLALLGPFDATLDGQPLVAFASAKVRVLLAYHVVEAGRPHTRQRLAPTCARCAITTCECQGP
jgi:DNA-binding SARP family transcriptional activator